MHAIKKTMATVLGTVLSVGLSGATTVAATTSASPLHSSSSVPIARSDYGINVFSYDNQMNAPSTIPGLTHLGMGMQQFPNANQWSWTTNSFRSGGKAPVSLKDWGHILQSTGNTGLFIFNYDENPSFTGGGTPADATKLTQYIIQNHLPITAIVIGSEEYGTWDHSANLNPSFSPQYYAKQAALIAQAIHKVDPTMKVGISFTLGQGPNSLSWDQTVLRTDGPYINFVSIHDYPNSKTLSNSQLLSILPTEIHQAMQFVQTEIAANVPSTYASRLQTWVTEYNPYGQPGPQSVQSVYAAAMVESAMLWRSLGASKLFIWSYDGQAHVATPTWPVASNSRHPFGLFALAGDGQSPELPVNTLYPSGQALSQFMHDIGTGGHLSVRVTPQSVTGQITSNQGSHIFVINTGNKTQTLPLSGSSVSVPPSSMQVVANQTLPARTTMKTTSSAASGQTFSTSAGVSNSSYQRSIPSFSSIGSLYPGQTVTLTGSAFGTFNHNSHVVISDQGTNYGGPGDAYRVTIKSWSPDQISFIVPNGSSGPPLSAGTAQLMLETSQHLISSSIPVKVISPLQLATTLSAKIAYPGQILTVSGSNFGSSQSNGYILIQQHGVNYGAPPDSYKVNIPQWSNHTIQVQIPNGSSGPALQPGPATITIVSTNGLTTAKIPLMITAPPTINAALTSANAVIPGQWVTVTGNDFGATQGSGYIQLLQNSIDYGAPGDWYHVAIRKWSNSSITFMVPMSGVPIGGHYEPNLQTGAVTVVVVNNKGISSKAMMMTAQ